jgi:hypothetical protein
MYSNDDCTEGEQSMSYTLKGTLTITVPKSGLIADAF